MAKDDVTTVDETAVTSEAAASTEVAETEVEAQTSEAAQDEPMVSRDERADSIDPATGTLTAETVELRRQAALSED